MKGLVLLLTLAVVLTGCDAIDAAKATKNMPKKMDDTVKKMDETECALKQGISFEAMLKEENGRVLTPVPFDLMPFAKRFAECSSDQDLAELAYLWMKKINEVTLDIPSPTEAQIEEFNHRQLHVYSALQAVAGFIPHDKVVRIIQDHVYGSSAYQDSVFELLMLRMQFIRDVRLENGLFSKGLINVGRVELAVELADEVDYLARLPFAGSIGISVTGFVEPFPDVKETLDPAQALAMWQKIKMKAERLNVDMKPGPGEEGTFPASKAKMAQALNKINQRISSWTGRP